MNISLEEMTEDQALAILDMLARKVGFTHANVRLEISSPEYLSIGLYHDSSWIGDGVFYKETCVHFTVDRCFVIAKSPFKYGIGAKTVLDALLRMSAEGIEFSVNGRFAEPEHGVEVFMHAGTTLEELLVMMDLEA